MSYQQGTVGGYFLLAPRVGEMRDNEVVRSIRYWLSIRRL